MIFRTRSVLFSLLAHALLLGFLFFHHGTETKPPLVPMAVMVELPERGEKVLGSGTSGGRKAGGKRPSPGFRWKTAPDAWEAGGAGAPHSLRAAQSETGNGGGSGRGAAVEGFANGMNLHDEGKFFPLAEKLWKRVDSFVTYPRDFVTEHLQGEVTLHIMVDEQGRFTGDFLEVVGEEPILRTYVMAMVAYALRKPLENLPADWLKKGPQRVPLALRFSFVLVNPGVPFERAPAFHFKNTFEFQRMAEASAKPIEDFLRWQAEHLPFIVAGPGLSINLPLIQSYLQKGAPPHEGEKRAYRMEMNQELWSQWITESRPGESGAAGL